MLSGLYLMKTRKIVALLVSTLFLLAMFPGCTESPEVPTRQLPLSSVERLAPADEDEGAGVPEYVPLIPSEIAALVTEALHSSEGQSIAANFNSLGYELRSNLTIAARKTTSPDLGAVTAVIPFAIPSDTTKAAFLTYVKRLSGAAFGLFFTVSQIDSPTTGTYQKIAPGLWLQVDSPGGLSPLSTFATQGRAFAECCGNCTLSNTGFCAACIFAGPGVFLCIGSCMAGVGYGCLGQCLLGNTFR